MSLMAINLQITSSPGSEEIFVRDFFPAIYIVCKNLFDYA